MTSKPVLAWAITYKGKILKDDGIFFKRKEVGQIFENERLIRVRITEVRKK